MFFVLKKQVHFNLIKFIESGYSFTLSLINHLLESRITALSKHKKVTPKPLNKIVLHAPSPEKNETIIYKKKKKNRTKIDKAANFKC